MVLTEMAAGPHHQGGMNPEVRPLRPGDVVEVRPRRRSSRPSTSEGALDGVPFMPEMLQYIGRRFTVSRRVEKICDTIADGEPPNARHRVPRGPPL